MTRIVRTAIVTVAATTLALGLAAPSQAAPGAPRVNMTTSGDTWFCVGVEHIDFGYCQGNPLPDFSELPSLPI